MPLTYRLGVKSLFRSKTFWVNVLTLAVTVAGFLPPKYAAIALPILNIVLRLVTDEPVRVF